MHQHPNYAATIRMLGGQVDAFLAEDTTRPLARLQVVQRKFGPLKAAWIPRGPVWAAAVGEDQKRDILDHLQYALPQGAVRLLAPERADDTDLLRGLRYRPVAAAQSYVNLDLRADRETRLARQHGKWRNRLRHAQNSGVRVAVRPFNPLSDQTLLGLEMAQRRSLGYRALPPGFTLAWASANRRAAQLFLALDHGRPIAYVLILLHAPTATYHIGWTSALGRTLSCHNLLLWRASNWLADRGYQELDLGLADADMNPGLARFKTGIGARQHHTGATMLALPRLRLPQIWHRAA